MFYRNLFIIGLVTAIVYVLPWVSASAQPLEPAAPNVAAPQDAARGVTLLECYNLALKRSETVAIQKEIIREAEGRFWQSLSTALPKVSYEIEETRQDGSGSSNFTLRKIPERRFTFSQPLFSGFKEFAAMAGSRAERRQRTQEWIRAQQLLFTDVSDAFYFLLSYQKNLEALEIQRQALLERVDELHKREELGRSRASEVASARARLSRLDAEVELVKAQAEVGEQLLEFLTGTQISSLIEENQDFANLNKEDYLAKVDHRPDVIAAQEALKVARKKVAVARAGFFPSAAVDGNYYDKRVGNAAPVKWDVTFSVSLPIFQGGENVGKLKEASSLARQQDLLVSSVRRSALLEIDNNYTNWLAAVRRKGALQKALEDSQQSYQFQKEDYSRNLVSNLDVLQALEDMESVRRELIAVDMQEHRLYSSLLVSVGEIVQ